MFSLEYLAGFFDGEGCVLAHRTRNTHEVICSVGNTVKAAVELFQIRFGGTIRERKYPKHPNWKPLWMWEIKHRHAEKFLKELVPFLHLKRHQAEVALELLGLIPGRGCFRKVHMTEQQIQEREKNMEAREGLVQVLHAANKRGLN